MIKIIIIVAIVAIVIAGITVGTMWFIKKTKADKDQLVANEVIAMIGMLDDKTITVDDEIEIERIKNKYSALTVAQKKLVSNRKVLDEVTDALEKAKVNEDVEKEKKANQDAADEVIRLIETLKEKTVTVDSENETLHSCRSPASPWRFPPLWDRIWVPTSTTASKRVSGSASPAAALLQK